MRLTRMGALLVMGALACGKKSGEAQAQQAPATDPAAAAPAAAAPAGPVVEVKMTGVGQKFSFEPATLTVAPGATVRFINVSGGPHNVSFWADSVPAGGAAVLKAAMANQMQDLSGPFLTQPNDHYDVSFANAPTGAYKGYCMPHVALGMKFTITVK